MGNRNSNRPSPNFGIGGDKSGEKVLVFPRGRTVFQSNPDDLVARAPGSVPGSVFGRKAVAVVFGRKHLTVVERQSQ